ncbi:borealin-2 [Esox lucius]|uniref:Borealin N-terminal domain-containing protein n=1 Tax=Esox lucius TaxID=8010 RepID=A0A3P9AE15_ESOLU|nr:borealin-2 [Esox lucius]
MAPRRTRKRSNPSEGHTNGQFSLEKRQKKVAIFMQQFEKEVQDRMNEIEAKLEELLATVDRAFKVELMKMPPAVQNTLIIDLINAEDNSAGDVTIAIKSESPEIHQPLSRKPSKKAVKISDGAPKQATSAHRKTRTDPLKGGKKTRSLINSSSTGSVRGTSFTNTKRAQSRLDKISGQTPHTGTRHRSVLQSASDDHLSCSLSGLVPHVTVSTSLGETLCLSDETIEDVDIGLLDDMAVRQMHKLRKLMDYLFNQVQENMQ